jgi:hypothetical protein
VADRPAEKHGGLLNIVACTDDGVLMINLGENAEGRQAMAEEPEIQGAIRRLGCPPHASKATRSLPSA